jgi:hypothetical protein
MTHYAILGGGRLARHMRHYFSLLNLPCSAWAREVSSDLNSHASGSPAERLRATVRPASHVLLLVRCRHPECCAILPARENPGALLGRAQFSRLPAPTPYDFGPICTTSRLPRIPFMVESGHPFEMCCRFVNRISPSGEEKALTRCDGWQLQPSFVASSGHRVFCMGFRATLEPPGQCWTISP